MKRAALVLLVIPLVAFWLYGCDESATPVGPTSELGTSPPLFTMTKVDVCHLDGLGEYHPISIADAAYDKHIAHGDKAVVGGACGAPPTVDQDGDGIADLIDQCPTGETGWASDAATDHDGDGCRDATEDFDDDNDGVGDTQDRCPLGETGSTLGSGSPYDLDEDGCHDDAEDPEIIKFVEGVIEQDELWVRGVTYRVVNDLWIRGILSPVLTIEDGVVVEFDTQAGIFVGYGDVGRLSAVGSILFTSASSTPQRGDWDGIYFGSNDSGSVLNGVTVEYGGFNLGNVVCDASSPTISNSTITDSHRWGIYVLNTATPTISDNSYSGNFSGDIGPSTP